jgi:uncharacterized protein (TIGR00270 family)
MCGRNDHLVKAVIAGSFLNVCKKCSNHGQVIEDKKVEITINRLNTAYTRHHEEELEEIVPNYSELLKKAREHKGLTQEQVARDIAEKESVVHKLEIGHAKPSVKLAKKLEQYFRIKLIETEQDEVPKQRKLDFKEGNLTIGDLINVDNDN